MTTKIAITGKSGSGKTTLLRCINFLEKADEGKIFVMGDNRNVSLDSRSSKIGLIDENYILGKALIRLYPFSEWKIYE